jgi:hypothetical protein
LPFGPNWMGRLSARLKADPVHKAAGERFTVSASWSPDGGYGQQTAAAMQAHSYCRAHVKEHDGGYRTPLSGYWGKFKEAYYIMEAEHGSWISPKFKVIYNASQRNENPDLETVFDAAENFLDRIIGTKKSLPNVEDRTRFVTQIANKFNHFMETKAAYMQRELRKIPN